MIVITDFMISSLRLRGDHLLVFAIIFSFTQKDGFEWFLNYEYISKWLGLTEQAIDAILDDLCEKEYIYFTKKGYVTISVKDKE